MKEAEKRVKQWKRAALLGALFCAALCVGAFAADPNYTGTLDSMTGEPVNTGEPLGGMTGGRVRVSSGVEYDFDAHRFVCDLGVNQGELRSTVVDGMVLNDTVSIDYTKDAPVSVFFNGEPFDGSLEQMSEAGDYVVTAQGDGRSRQVMQFTIVGKSTNALQTFSVPDGFYVEEATRDGEDVYLDRYSVNMEEEGHYVVNYACFSTGIRYSLETDIDRTPPELTLSGKFNEEMRTRSAVKFTGLQPGDTVSVVNMGTAVKPELSSDGTGGTLYNEGSYTLTVYDAAGNRSAYEFVILTYLDANSVLFILLVLMCVGGVTAYVIVKSKKLKIG